MSCGLAYHSKSKVAFLIDLDGVLVKDKKLNLFEDTQKFLNFLRVEKVPFRILSNNSTRAPKRIVDDLKARGLDIKDEEFISPLRMLPDYLRAIGIKKCLVIGTPTLKEFLNECGFEVLNSYKVDAVIIGQDRELNFEKLKLAVSAVHLNGSKIIPVNLSRIVKDDDGLYFLGSGSVALSIAHACNYKEDIPNLGKPSREFIEYALRDMPKDEVYIVSDDIYTDLLGASKLGLKTIFLTTGKYSEREIEKSGFNPDYTFHSLTQLIDFISEITKKRA